MSQGSRCSASGNGGLLIWGVSADVDMGELVDFFGADPIEMEFTASSRRLAGSKTTSEPQKLWCAILGLNQSVRILRGSDRFLSREGFCGINSGLPLTRAYASFTSRFAITLLACVR